MSKKIEKLNRGFTREYDGFALYNIPERAELADKINEIIEKLNDK